MFKAFFRAVPRAGHVPLERTDLTSLVLRLGLAAIFIHHGLNKVLPENNRWGNNWLAAVVKTPSGVSQEAPYQTRVEAFWQVSIAWGELLGGVALALGVLTRLAACGEILIQSGGIYFASTDRDFSLLRAGGGEYNFALLAMCLAVVVLGAGRWSFDWLVQQRRAAARTPLTNTTPAPSAFVTAPGP